LDQIFSERYEINAALLRSHFRLSVCLSAFNARELRVDIVVVQNLLTPPDRPGI